jgi:hypothetical protein
MKSFFKKLKYTPHEIADAIVIDLINLYEKIYFLYRKFTGKYYFLKKNKILKNTHKEERIFILGNAPSLNNFDLKKLKNEIIIMVNRSFDHPDYEIIKPKYHIFVDPKLATGVWPLSYIDEIYKKNPNVKLIFNSEWYYLEKFKEFRDKKNVFWVKSKSISLLFNNFNNNLSDNISTMGVIGHAISSAIYLGSKKIYILGVELNGIIKLLADKDSHFSGKDPDYKNYTSWEWARDLGISSRGFRIWHRFNDHCKKNKIELINLSKTGLIDFMHEEDFNSLFK